MFELFWAPYRIPLKEQIVNFVLFKGVPHETHMVSRGLQEEARVCRGTRRILVVDFEAFEKNWLKRSKLKRRLQHHWKILSPSVDKHAGFSRAQFSSYLERADPSLEKYEANFATGGFFGHSVPMFRAVVRTQESVK